MTPLYHPSAAMSWAELHADYAERAAISEFDGGLDHVDANAQADNELYRVILDELIAAAHRRYEPAMESLVAAAGLASGRQPLWGIGLVAASGAIYRPAQPSERLASPAIIVPASSLGAGLVDLVAQSLATGRMASRLGVAELVGLDEVDRSRETNEPLLIFENVTQWLRGGTRGAVIVDWKRAASQLDGVSEIRTTQALAPRLHAITRRCWLPPKIVVPTARGASHV